MTNRLADRQAAPSFLQAAQFLRDKLNTGKTRTMPRYVLTLGSGLAGMADSVEIELEFALSEIPFIKTPTVTGHTGRIIIGNWHGVRVLMLQGRLHSYEGYSLADVVFPFRVLALAGAEYFFLTNSAGGLSADYVPSDLVLIRDHINLMNGNPLTGPNDEALGPRFPDLTGLYDQPVGDHLVQTARQNKIRLFEGIYLATPGPSYETPAEVKMYRSFGATLVGMSTVPEAIALKHMGKKVIALSCVTNLAAGMSGAPLDHADVLEVAKRAYPSLSLLWRSALNYLEKQVL